MMNDNHVFQVKLKALHAGGQILMQFWRQNPAIQYKDDLSPVTQADWEAHHKIATILKHDFPDIPLISEEDNIRQLPLPSVYFLLDPLDGTRHFIAGSDEFCINLALIKDGYPYMGAIFAPAKELLYWADHYHSFKQQNCSYKNILSISKDHATKLTSPSILPTGILLHGSSIPKDEYIAHIIHPEYHPQSYKKLGSALKFGYLADGQADYYIHTGRTGYWDTAAGQLIVERSGGVALSPNGARLHCQGNTCFNKNGFLISRHTSYFNKNNIIN